MEDLCIHLKSECGVKVPQLGLLVSGFFEENKVTVTVASTTDGHVTGSSFEKLSPCDGMKVLGRDQMWAKASFLK